MADSTIMHLATVFPINAEALQPESKPNQRRVILKEFSLNTSTHGIPGIARSESIHNRAFWLVSFVGFAGIMAYFIVQAVLAYYKYPTLTSTEFIDEWPQRFPAVTICNYSPLRFDKLIEPFLNYTNALNLTNTSDTNINNFTSQQALYISDFIQYKLNQNESLIDFYYPLSVMLIKCVYNGEKCSTDDFIQFISPVHGLCYTFNAEAQRINNGTVHYNNENGYSGELHLELYMHSQQYVPYLSNAASIVAMIHENRQLPHVDRVGMHLIPGRKHKVGYSKKTSVFLPSPYTTCSDTITPGMQALYDQFSGAKYTYELETCFKVALQTYIYDECGCVSPFEWAARYVIPHGKTDIIRANLCDVSNRCYSEAADRFQGSSTISAMYAASCGLECFHDEFILKISSSLAPSKWFMNDIKEFVNLSSASIPLPSNWSTTWAEDIQANYVGIDVICETTRTETYTQQATLGAVDVLSNIGGQTGLWIGISFLSLMEVAEMLYRLIRCQLHRLREKICRRRHEESQTKL